MPALFPGSPRSPEPVGFEKQCKHLTCQTELAISTNSAKTPITTNTAQASATLAQKSLDAEYCAIRPFEVAFLIVMSVLVILGSVLTVAFAVLGEKRFWE